MLHCCVHSVLGDKAECPRAQELLNEVTNLLRQIISLLQASHPFRSLASTYNYTNKDSTKHFDDIRNEQVLEGEEMKSILESHSEMLDYISKNSGRPVTNVLEVLSCSFELFQLFDNIFEINQLDYLYDTLLVETIYNKTLPEWTKVKNISLSSFKCNTHCVWTLRCQNP